MEWRGAQRTPCTPTAFHHPAQGCRADNRYVYYADRRPYYVASLPGRAVYVTPTRRVFSTRYVPPSRYDGPTRYDAPGRYYRD